MPIEVIPNGIDRSLIDRPLNPSAKYNLTLGRLDRRHKGLDLLMQAVMLSHCKLQFFIAGDGPDRGWLQGELAKCVSKAKWVGRVDGSAKTELLENAAFFVAPSRCEGIPLAFLEALAFGLPLIVWDIRDNEWLPVSCAIKVPPFDVQALAEAIERLANSDSDRVAMSQRAKEFIRQFDWDRIAERYEKNLSAITGLA